ncbi:MAG: ComEC/Rec2 family competence protein [Candidatus Omnitrophota bacterium]
MKVKPLRLSFDPLPSVLSLFITGILLAKVLPWNPQIYLFSAGLTLGISLLLLGTKSIPKKSLLIPLTSPFAKGGLRGIFSLLLLFPFLFIGISHSQYFQKPELNDISRFRMKSPIIIEGVIINNPSEDNGQAVVQTERITEPISIWPVTGNILLVFRERPVPLRYGDRLRVRLVMGLPVSKGDFDYAGYLARHRIYAAAYPGKTDLTIIGTEGLSQNKIDYLPEAILERDKERRSWRTPCGTEAMSDAVVAQKRPGPSGSPIFGSLRRCSSVMCRSGHRTFVAPCTTHNAGTPIRQFYSATTHRNKNHLLPFAFHVRSRIRNILTELIPEEPNLSILEMMSFGLRNPKPELKEPFQKVGVYHLLVVSGLHVGFFLLFLHFILSPFALHPRLKALLYLPAISAYTLACGLSAPVVRAGLMAGFYYLGIVLNRRSKPVYAISLAAFVLLLLNPLSLFDAGWQLTFGITLGLITGTKTLNPYFRRLPDWLANSLSAAIIGQLVSLPLTAFHFGNVPFLALVANLMFVPLSGLIVLETFLTVFCGPIGFLFAATATALTSVFYQTTRFLSELPFTFVTVPKGNYLYFLGYLPLIALFLYSRKRPLL